MAKGDKQVPSVLGEAQALVHGDRGKTYGHPIDDFGCTAAMWAAYLSHRYGLDIELAPEDVALMMACVKISRLAATPGHRDSIVDLAGYAETCGMVLDERVRRGAEAAGLGAVRLEE